MESVHRKILKFKSYINQFIDKHQKKTSTVIVGQTKVID